MTALPMFPLGRVLLPHGVVPLHVFEARYRAMMDAVLAGRREFGVVLISGGHEVGGGERRTDVGCVARIARTEPLAGGRSLVIGVGSRRIRVERWLPDDPYPRAEVVDLEDEHEDNEVVPLLDGLVPRLRRVLALQAELGQAGAPSTFELDEDRHVACWQIAGLAPVTPFDAQRLLATDACGRRLRLLDELVDGIDELLRFRLQGD